MKRTNKLLIYISLILLVAISLSGCKLLPTSSNSLDGYSGYLWNGGDRSKHLVKFAPELDEIPRDYLSYINLNPDEYNIETLNQWSSNNLGAQAAYHSFVYRFDEGPDYGFYIWVLDDGRVNDTRFTYDLEPALQDYFTTEITKSLPDARVFTSLSFHNMPSKEWSEADGIENLLNSEDDYRLFIYIVYGPDVSVSEADVENLKTKFSNLNDVNVLLYRLDNPDEVEKDDLYNLNPEYKFIEYK